MEHEDEARQVAKLLSAEQGVSGVEVVALSAMLDKRRTWRGFGVRWHRTRPATGLDPAGSRFAVGSGDRLTLRPFAAGKPESVGYVVNGQALGVVDADDETGLVALLPHIPHSVDPPCKFFFLRTDDLGGNYQHHAWHRDG